jgi:hypothetical protein
MMKTGAVVWGSCHELEAAGLCVHCEALSRAIPGTAPGTSVPAQQPQRRWQCSDVISHQGGFDFALLLSTG